ncbi:MAG: 16S rRNA (uracil(1498)-N(3))-methyltransferase [Lachnospiraceae bacterium]
MHQFFVENEQISEKTVQITGKDVNHICNVLRMQEGEQIRVSDPQGMDYFCHITQLGKEKVVAEIDRVQEEGSELPGRIYLFQGLPKSDKMEWIIQKAVELGVYAVIPVTMKNSVVRLDAKKAQAKQKRWQAISESAAKQSKRSRIPEIGPVMTFSQALAFAKEQCEICLIPYENERGMRATEEALQKACKKKSVAVFIGPEGGFDPKEIAMAQDTANLISLGRRILRTETAGLTMLSLLMVRMELEQEQERGGNNGSISG